MKILLEKSDKNHNLVQILESDGIYAIYYDDHPINCKKIKKFVDICPKYKRVSFSNKGHALNVCKKLNEFFKTDKFCVYLMEKKAKVL